jgi:VanZ family protein
LLLRAALLAWLGTLSVAALDEWHQTFIPSRTGTVRDVGLDSVAGVAFLVIAYWWLRRSNKASSNQP